TRAKQDRARSATNAVRLLRRLALSTADRPLGADTPTTTHGWIQTHVQQTGWVDRAASALWHHRGEVPAFDQALGVLYERVRAWRAEVDAQFATAVNRWNSGHSPTDPQLRAENLLGKVALPLAQDQAPLIVVLDGMSVEVAVQLAEDIQANGRLIEIGRSGKNGSSAGREGALATVPSTTTCSRASLLTGSLTVGKQDTERSGFAALWPVLPSEPTKQCCTTNVTWKQGSGPTYPPPCRKTSTTPKRSSVSYSTPSTTLSPVAEKETNPPGRSHRSANSAPCSTPQLGQAAPSCSPPTTGT